MAYEWTELAYLATAGRQQRDVLFRAGRAVRVLGAGRAVRKLVAAAGRDSGRADVPAVFGHRRSDCAACDVNIFTQIGFVVLVGLASKNAILIVEFAKRQHEAGVPRREATLEAVRLRLRPILMTSFAFILGVVPLVIATGAGAEMRRTLGIAVFSGMLGVTLFGVFLTPIFFYVIQAWNDRHKKSRHIAPSKPATEPQVANEVAAT